jgi:hypothetical protein
MTGKESMLEPILKSFDHKMAPSALNVVKLKGPLWPATIKPPDGKSSSEELSPSPKVLTQTLFPSASRFEIKHELPEYPTKTNESSGSTLMSYTSSVPADPMNFTHN